MVKQYTQFEQQNNEFLKIHRVSLVIVCVDDYSGHVWTNAKDEVRQAMHNLPETKQDVIDFKEGMSCYCVKPEDINLIHNPRLLT